MALKGGRGMNPYFGLDEGDESALGEAFLHLVGDPPARPGLPWTARGAAFIGERLRERGFLREDGSANRNAIKHAVAEF